MRLLRSLFSVLPGPPPRTPRKSSRTADCLTCHSDPTLTEDVNGSAVASTVDQNKFKHSVHGSMFTCVDCHNDVHSLAHDTTPKKVSCAQCHADEGQGYAHSIHAR